MSQSDGRETTLLVVDDEPAIVRLVMEVLKDSPLRVLTATRGDEAVELYRQHRGRIDLVLLDLQMHPWSGHEVLEELRRIDPHVRVAVMSGSPSESAITGGNGPGVVTVFPKPFKSVSELSAAIHDLVKCKA